MLRRVTNIVIKLQVIFRGVRVLSLIQLYIAVSLSAIREFKKLRRQLQRKLLIKIELCVKSSLLRLFHFGRVVKKIGEVHFRLLGTNGFHVKAENERFTVASS